MIRTLQQKNPILTSIRSHAYINKYYQLNLKSNQFNYFTDQFVSPGLYGSRNFHSSLNPMLFRFTSQLQSRKSKVVIKRHYPCTHTGCDIEFATQGGLNRHLPLHDLSRPFVCSQCKLRFKTFRNLFQHEGIMYP